MRLRNAVSAAALATLTGSCLAQISSVGPFTGPYTEGFETQNPPCPPCFFNCIPNRLFNNTADLCDTTPGGTGAHITSGWSFMCTIFPHGGGRFTGSAGGPYRLTFDTPVSSFGGYFGTNSGTDGAVIVFYDASNNAIGSPQNATTAGCTWTWNGWASTVPIKSMTITGNNPFGGGFTDMDDLEYLPSEVSTGCYPNCDGSTGTPCLTVADFGCFLNAFAGGSSYANCDGSTTIPVLTVADFGCFLNAFAGGCSNC